MMKLDSLEKRRVLNFAAYLLGCTDMQKGHTEGHTHTHGYRSVSRRRTRLGLVISYSRYICAECVTIRAGTRADAASHCFGWYTLYLSLAKEGFF